MYWAPEMSRFLVVEPMKVASVTSSRGSGAANLMTPDPKEAWADSATGSAATLLVDLGGVRTIDTIFLGYVSPPTPLASWSISGGSADAGEAPIQALTTLCVPDVAGDANPTSHALWTGPARAVRYLAISLTQDVGLALTAGALVVGKSFNADLGQEWGAGRKPIDTGSATQLPSGGFAVVEGARKCLFTWTFGDLSLAEADQLEMLALRLGKTKPGLVIEDDSRTPGLRSRIHYGLFEQWRAYERRNRRQTRWEIGIEEWV